MVRIFIKLYSKNVKVCIEKKESGWLKIYQNKQQFNQERLVLKEVRKTFITADDV